MKKMMLLWAALCIACAGFAQDVRRLHLGDTIPGIILYAHQLETGKKFTVNTNKLDKKITILEFWSTSCGACISAIPKKEKLQQIFQKDVQILMVNTQDEWIAESFFVNRRRVKKLQMNIPLVKQDTLLEKYFPVRTLPHLIWLDEKGIVRSITEGQTLDSANLFAMVNNPTTALEQKNDLYLGWTWREPLFAAGNCGNGEKVKWHSVLSDRVEGIPTGAYVAADDENGYTSLIFNLPIKEFYQIAYNTDTALALISLGIPTIRTIYRVRDTSKLVCWHSGKFVKENTYTYQLMTPKVSVDVLRRYMKEDLRRYFGYQAKLVKKKMQVWVLKAEDPSLLCTKGGRDTSMSDDINGIKLKNMPAPWLTRKFYNHEHGRITIDDANLTGNIDVIIQADLTKPEAINRALKKYRMSYLPEEREVDCLEISDPEDVVSN